MLSQDFSNSIISTMMPHLTEKQVSLLAASLQQELYRYELRRKSNIKTTQEQQDLNATYIRKFAMDKQIEGMSQRTIYQYVRETKKFLDVIQKDFKHVTKDDVTYYFLLLMEKGKISNVSIDNTRRFVSPFFNWCVINDLITKNPFLGFKRIKQEKKIKEILTTRDIVLLKQNCKTKRERALIDFLWATGVRVSELKRLKVEDINFNDGTVHIYGEKTKTWRKVYLGKQALDHVKSYIKSRPYESEYVFCSSRKPHEMVCTQTIEKEIRMVAYRAGINKHCTVHLFRRSLATRLYSKGMDMKQIAMLLGHTVRVLEECYLILDDSDIKANYAIYSK